MKRFQFLLLALLMPFITIKANNQPETETQFTHWLKEHIPLLYTGNELHPHNGWYQVFIPEYDLTVSWGLVPLKKSPLKDVEGLFENKSIFIAKAAEGEWTKSSKVEYHQGVGYHIAKYNSSAMGAFEVGQLTVIQFDGKPNKFVDQMAKTYKNNPEKSETGFVTWLKDYIKATYPAQNITYHGAWYQYVIPSTELMVTWGTMSANSMELGELHGLRKDKSIFIEYQNSTGWEKNPNVFFTPGFGYNIPKYDAETMGKFEVGKRTVIQFDGGDAHGFVDELKTIYMASQPKAKKYIPFMQWLFKYIPAQYPNARMIDHHYWLQGFVNENLVANWAQINDGADLHYLEGHNLVHGQPFFIEKGVKMDWENHPSVTYFDAAGYYVTAYDSVTMRNWIIRGCNVIQFDGDPKIFVEKMAKDWVNDQPSLAEAFKDAFLIGGAYNYQLIAGNDPGAAALAIKHYNAATSENDMKWSLIHPELGKYNWGPADKFMDFCEKHEMVPIGHTLVWKSQVPGWVFKDDNGNPMTREALLKRMEDHINQVVGRYKGRIHGWDVVNEALNEDGTMRMDNWCSIIGEGDESKIYDHIEYAFRYAHAADPEAELYYNDYNLDTKKAKCDGAVAIVKHLQSKGVRIDGVGIQLHAGLAGDTYPQVKDLEYAITSFAALGVKVMVTELDMKTKRSGYQGADINLMNHNATQDSEALTPETQKIIADKYAEIFSVLLKHKKDITRVTLWGVYDGRSWIAGSPLLFDKNYQPKEAFYSVLKTAGKISNEQTKQ